MSYRFLRVFFGGPIDSDVELRTFLDAVAHTNETTGIPAGLLLTPVNLPAHMGDKRAFQPTVDHNIRDAEFCLFLLKDSWGPETRNFSADFAYACSCAADPSQRTRQVAVLFDASATPRQPELSAVEGQEYSGPEDFRARVTSLLEGWLQSIESEAAAPVEAAGHAS